MCVDSAVCCAAQNLWVEPVNKDLQNDFGFTGTAPNLCAFVIAWTRDKGVGEKAGRVQADQQWQKQGYLRHADVRYD